jgi:Fe-Mn family superoxide dismutase
MARAGVLATLALSAATAVAAARPPTPAPATLTLRALTLPPLSYGLDELAPHMSNDTMHSHLHGNFAAYATKATAALSQLAATDRELAHRGIGYVLQHLADVKDDGLRATLRNQGGGYVNHEMWFGQLAPPAHAGAFEPSSAVGAALLRRYTGEDIFRELFRAAALRVFGSGWVWLEVDATGDVARLEITWSPNQDTPASDPRRTPLIGLDVWEHAYVRDFSIDRAAFVDAFWAVLDWRVVDARFRLAVGEGLEEAGRTAGDAGAGAEKPVDGDEVIQELAAAEAAARGGEGGQEEAQEWKEAAAVEGEAGNEESEEEDEEGDFDDEL